MGKKFNHLNVPSHWKHYWTKYPEGYTILEALLNWVAQVDKMVDNINDWNEYLDDFVMTFDKDLQGTVVSTLREWQDSGFLDVVIDEALQTQIDDVSSQLADRAIDVRAFGAKPNDSTFDSSDAIQQALNSTVEGQRVLIIGKFYINKPIVLPPHTITLEGLNMRESVIIKGNSFVGEGAIILSGSGPNDENRIKYTQLRNFAIEGNGKGGKGLILKHLNFPVIENVMSIRNDGAGVYIEDVQDLDSRNLISIYNTVNMELQGRNTGLDFYKTTLKYGRERNLVVTTDGTLKGNDYNTSNRTDRLTFWGGLIEGDSATSAPASGTPLIELKGCSRVTFHEVGFSKGKYPQFTGIKIDKVNINGVDLIARDITFNNNVMYSTSPPDAGIGIHIVNAQRVLIDRFSAPGIEVPIQLETGAFETTITRDCNIEFSKVVNKSSTTFESSRNNTGLWTYISRLVLQNRLMQFESSDTTNTRELLVDPSTRQTIFRRTSGVEGDALDYFKIYGTGIFEPYILRINPNNPPSTLSGVVRLNDGNLEIRNEANNGWDVFQKVLSGPTENRPSSNRFNGLQYFDTTLGKPIWWLSGKGWVDATGTVV